MIDSQCVSCASPLTLRGLRICLPLLPSRALVRSIGLESLDSGLRAPRGKGGDRGAWTYPARRHAHHSVVFLAEMLRAHGRLIVNSPSLHTATSRLSAPSVERT